jgi:asparagine synthase (glutamine-hydrolysing)
MARALAHRGEPASWTRARIALAAFGTRPVVDPATGIVLVAHARIDNRSELPPAGPSDAELILAAFRAWGQDCVPRLAGDFAFALWDPRQQLVFCARDPMGVKPFYYVHDHRQFACATEIKALLALPGVSHAIDEEQVALYLSTVAVDRVSTFYGSIRRLPAAHTLAVSRRGITLREYWRADDVRALRLGSDAAYAAAFSETFRAAVGARLRDAPPVGATLSGGLDSSAVVCTARQLGVRPLHTFSLVFPTLEGRALRAIDERPYIDRVIAGGGLTPHLVRGDELSPLGDLDRTLANLDQPFGAPNLYLHLGMYAAAQRAGVRVLLDGFDGDTTVSHGISRLNDLAHAGQWSAFESEVRAFALHRAIAPAAVLPHFGFPLLAELARGGRLIRWATAARELARRFDLSRREVVQRYGLSPLLPRLGGDGAPGFVRPALRRRIAERLHWLARGARTDTAATERAAHLKGLAQPLYQQTLELADQAAAAFGIEPAYPFFDRSLIELCVAVPPEQKFASGWSRLLLRRAMQGVLPPEIQWRGSKSNLSHNFAPRLRAGDGALLRGATFDALAPYVDVARARDLRDRVLSGLEADQQTLLRLTILARWLERPQTALLAA